MTVEEQREQWLKRLLPGLAIGVIYAVFIGPWVSGKADKSIQEHRTIATKGISAAALPGMDRQLNELETEIAKLKQSDANLQRELGGYAGFLANPTANNGTGAQLAQLLADHQLRVLDEKLDEQAKPDNLPKTLRETRAWLQTALDMQDGMKLLDIHFAGTYVDTYTALAVLAEGKINALPVSLTMQEWQEGKDSRLMEWHLVLWI